MTPQLLRETGEALYGRQWQTQLAEDLDVTDRTIRRWAAGSYNVPLDVWTELRTLIDRRCTAMGAVQYRILKAQSRAIQR